jgi:hypothetical protein
MSDFGAGKLRRPKRPKMVFVVLAIAAAIGLAIVSAVLVQNRNAKIAEAESWNVQGAPCPELTQAAFEAGHMAARKKFTYDAFTLGRASGHVDCNQVGAGGGHKLGAVLVCQFTSPIMMTVKTPAGEYFYNIGVGHPASVVIEKNVPRCVMASNFRM